MASSKRSKSRPKTRTKPNRTTAALANTTAAFGPPKPGEGAFTFTGTLSQMERAVDQLRAERRVREAAEPRPETPYQLTERARATAEAPALKLTDRHFTIRSPHLAEATIADLLAYQQDSGCHTFEVLQNAVVAHLSELAILQRAFCGDEDDVEAGTYQDDWYHAFVHMRRRLETAMILDERIKAANRDEVAS